METASSDVAAKALMHRHNLPAVMCDRSQFKVWEFLKNCIGKDLTRISMPIQLNEPLSFLQRLCEYLEYAELLSAAAATEDSVQRMELISAFAISGASSNWARVGKPFNSLFGETYELDRRSDLGYSCVCEQVSHHPPTSAFHAEAADGSWKFYGAITPKLTFWGKSIEVTPRGQVTVVLPGRSEAFSWQSIQCKIHNVIVGDLWVEHCGQLTIKSTTGCSAKLKWRPTSRLDISSHRVDGFVCDSRGARVSAVYGRWNDSLYSVAAEVWQQHKKENGFWQKRLLSAKAIGRAASDSDADSGSQWESGADAVHFDLQLPGQRHLWRRYRRPENSKNFYAFTHFALQLNNNADQRLMANLPPTDSRHRPDVRAMESGKLEEAQAEKNRLEQRQRSERRQLPLWFARTGPAAAAADSEEISWKFTGDYWRRIWTGCYDIF